MHVVAGAADSALHESHSMKTEEAGSSRLFSLGNESRGELGTRKRNAHGFHVAAARTVGRIPHDYCPLPPVIFARGAIRSVTDH